MRLCRHEFIENISHCVSMSVKSDQVFPTENTFCKINFHFIFFFLNICCDFAVLNFFLEPASP